MPQFTAPAGPAGSGPLSAAGAPPSPAQPVRAGEVLVIAAHPDWRASRANRRLRDAAAGGAPRAALRDLYRLYPDFFVDVAAEQAALARARLVVWLHPVHWYAMPALMKLWLDEVFAFGWAYGPGGRALAGKDLWLVCTTGGPEDSYRPEGTNRHDFADFLRPAEQTAALTGLRWLPPMVVHGAHRASEAGLDAAAARFADRLAAWPGWPELAGIDAPPAPGVPADERPPAAPGD